VSTLCPTEYRIKMKGYRTSKDYKRLKELLDKGYEIVCFIDLGYTDRKYTNLARKQMVQGVDAYNIIGFWYHRNTKEFERACVAYDIEFIEPTEED